MQCLNCNKMVMDSGLQLEDGTHCIEPGSVQPIEDDDGEQFVTCPHCKAKNILFSIPSDHGPEKLYFHHYKIN